MSQHAHAWRVQHYLLLSLPTRANLAERLVIWQCPCGGFIAVSGEFRPGLPLGHPAQWEGVAKAEERLCTPDALEARRQHHRRIV